MTLRENSESQRSGYSRVRRVNEVAESSGFELDRLWFESQLWHIMAE